MVWLAEPCTWAYLEGQWGPHGPPIVKKILLQRSMCRCSMTLLRSSTVIKFSGDSSGQRLQQNSTRTLLRQHSAVAAALSVQSLSTVDHPRNADTASDDVLV